MDATTLTGYERSELGRKARVATLDALHALGGQGWRESIRELAMANGAFTARELAAPPPEAVGGKFQRLVDHQLAWELTNLRREGVVANPSRAVWKLAGAVVEPVVPAVEISATDDRGAELCAMTVQGRADAPKRSLLRRLISA